jgi:hypothetical protein
MNQWAELDEAGAAAALRIALGQLDFTRRYVLQLLEQTPRERWYEIAAGSHSHIAWQVGHLAVSEYGLLLFRLRGRQPEDLDLLPGPFRKQFGRGSVPRPSSAAQPSPEELLDRMAQIRQTAERALRDADPQQLLEPVEMPYAVYPRKIGAILFCPLHEQLHAGQIGALRRGLGLEPVQ